MNPPPLSSAPAKASSRGCFLYSGIVIATFLLVFMTACVITYVMPKKFESTAVYQIRPSPRMGMPPGQIMTPQFFATEFEVIRATLTLKPVVQQLDLTTRWNMTEEEAIALLRSIVQAQNIRGTDLVKITVKHTDPEQARDIAKEVYLSYKKRRDDKERELVAAGLKELEKAVSDQNALVEEKRIRRDIVLRRMEGRTINPNPDAIIDSALPRMQKELEFQQDLLDQMREKIAVELINTKFTSSTELHEEPVVPQSPSSPNVTLNLMLGATIGLIFGCLMALFVRLVFGRRISG